MKSFVKIKNYFNFVFDFYADYYATEHVKHNV